MAIPFSSLKLVRRTTLTVIGAAATRGLLTYLFRYSGDSKTIILAQTQRRQEGPKPIVISFAESSKSRSV
jgi:hypothetical protein